jgi:hypothetical protein
LARLWPPPVLRHSIKRVSQVRNLYTANVSSVAVCRGLAIKTDVSGALSRAAVRHALIHVSSHGIATAYAWRCQWLWTTTQADRNAMNRIVYIVGLVVIVLVIMGFFGLR